MGAAAEGDVPMRRIVSGTGPLLSLTEARALDLLGRAGQVHVPEVVAAEMEDETPGWSEQRPAWIVVKALAGPYRDEAVAWQEAGLLGVREAEAVALARQLKADWLLTDDAAARLFGRTFGLEVHGSLAIVLWAAAVRHLGPAEADAALIRLAKSPFWISAMVLREARATLKDIFR